MYKADYAGWQKKKKNCFYAKQIYELYRYGIPKYKYGIQIVPPRAIFLRKFFLIITNNEGLL